MLVFQPENQVQNHLAVLLLSLLISQLLFRRVILLVGLLAYPVASPVSCPLVDRLPALLAHQPQLPQISLLINPQLNQVEILPVSLHLCHLVNQRLAQAHSLPVSPRDSQLFCQVPNRLMCPQANQVDFQANNHQRLPLQRHLVYLV